MQQQQDRHIKSIFVLPEPLACVNVFCCPQKIALLIPSLQILLVPPIITVFRRLVVAVAEKEFKFPPTIEQLEFDIKEFGYGGTGKKYGVSDNAIRKWICRQIFGELKRNWYRPSFENLSSDE